MFDVRTRYSQVGSEASAAAGEANIASGDMPTPAPEAAAAAAAAAAALADLVVAPPMWLATLTAALAALDGGWAAA